MKVKKRNQERSTTIFSETYGKIMNNSGNYRAIKIVRKVKST